MTRQLRDVDGAPLRRDTDGELVVDHDALPNLTEFERCSDHTYRRARACPECWAEIKAGDRPRWQLGQSTRTEES